MTKYVLFFVLMFSNLAFSQEKVIFETLPVPEGIKTSNDPSVTEIEWYRWTTKNFTIHSVDLQQGQYLFANIEQMKTWVLERWGFQDFDFSAEVRVWCAPDRATMKKLFNLEDSFGEVRKEQGKIIISHLWIVLDMKPAETIPPGLTIIALKEYELKYNVKLGWWVHRGLPTLNMTLGQIRRRITELDPYLKNDVGMFFTKSLFGTEEETWKKQTVDIKKLFDVQAATMCLLVRKEFGQNNFLRFSQSSDLNSLGFKDNGKFDSVFKRYMFYLVDDIKQNKTPDSYLQIFNAAKE